MIRPPVSPGVKQNLHIARHRVDPTEVWAFVQIAAMASEREIFDIIASAVLASDYVLDLMRHRAMLLAKLAVLATVSSPVTDKQPESGVHWLIGNPREMPLGFEPEDCDKVRSVDQSFVFGSLVRGEVALVCAFTKHFDPRQHLWIDPKRHQTPSRFCVETEAQRLQKTVESGSRVHALTLSREENGHGARAASAAHWRDVNDVHTLPSTR